MYKHIHVCVREREREKERERKRRDQKVSRLSSTFYHRILNYM